MLPAPWANPLTRARTAGHVRGRICGSSVFRGVGEPATVSARRREGRGPFRGKSGLRRLLHDGWRCTAAGHRETPVRPVGVGDGDGGLRGDSGGGGSGSVVGCESVGVVGVGGVGVGGIGVSGAWQMVLFFVFCFWRWRLVSATENSTLLHVQDWFSRAGVCWFEHFGVPIN